MEENELLTNELLAGDLPEPEAERTYHFTAGQEETTALKDWTGKAEVQYLTEAELKEAFEADKTLKATFESFDNYLGYMNDRQDLIDSGDYNPDWWANEDIPLYDEPMYVMEDGSKVPASEYDPSMGNPVSIEGSIPGATGGATNVEHQQTSKLWADQSELLEESFKKYATGTQSPSDSAFQHTAQDNNMYDWNGTSWVKTKDRDKVNYIGLAIKTAVTAAIAYGTGVGVSGLASGLGAAASGAAGGAAGSAISGAINGDLTAEGIVTGAIIGAIGGWADQLKGMDSAIANGGALGAADDFVNATSELLNIPYDEALGILQGVATGAVNGGDLEDIALGAVSSWGTVKTQDFLQGIYGDTVQVDDWFKDGQSNIPIEALDPFIEGAWNAALRGEGDAGDIARMLWDYHREGGDLDFLLPPGVDLGGSSVLDWIDSKLPDVTINWGEDEFDVTYEEGLGEEDGFEEEEKDKVTVDVGTLPGLPDVDLDVDVEIPEIKCPTGEKWSTDLSKCIPDVEIPEVKCPTGERWSSDLSQCIPDVPEIPDAIECMEGFEWDDLLGECVEIPELPDVVECMEGFQWDDLLGKCVEIDVPEVPDVVECVEGFEWSDILKKCVEIKKPETPEVDVDVPEVKCPTGEKWSSDLSECVPDIGLPDVGKGEPSDFTPQWTGLFEYTDIDVYQGKKLEPFRQYIAKAKGMLS